MLFKQHHLDAIKAGNVTLAFRRWTKPAAKEGSLLKTSVGLLQIGAVKEVKASAITAADARAAGYDTKEALLQELTSRPAGNIYKIKVQYHAPDPRIALRAKNSLAEADYLSVKSALDRLDKYSKTGPWTRDTLLAIQANPGLRAADLALQTGREKDWLKLNIRKLKEHGLTISLDPGYKISPRGALFIKRLTGH